MALLQQSSTISWMMTVISLAAPSFQAYDSPSCSLTAFDDDNASTALFLSSNDPTFSSHLSTPLCTLMHGVQSFCF